MSVPSPKTWPGSKRAGSGSTSVSMASQPIKRGMTMSIPSPKVWQGSKRVRSGSTSDPMASQPTRRGMTGSVSSLKAWLGSEKAESGSTFVLTAQGWISPRSLGEGGQVKVLCPVGFTARAFFDPVYF